MENYEVNVLTRKGGWKKLSQSSIDEKLEEKQVHDNEEDNTLSISIKDNVDERKISTNPEKHKLPNEERNLFDDFHNISIIINELQNVEKEKQQLFEKLSHFESQFLEKRNVVSKKLDKVKKEHDLYEKTINLINSLKEI